MNARNTPLFLLLLAGPLVLSACLDPRESNEYAASDAVSTAASPGRGEVVRPPTTSLPPVPTADGPIYVHGPYTLYKFSPSKAELTQIGDFDCMRSEMSGTADSGMHDLAVDSSGHLYGVGKVRASDPGDPDLFTAQVIVSIDKETGHCTKEMTVDGKLVNPQGGLELRGLSFIPAGVLAPAEETLVALEIYGSYIQLDLKNQRAVRIGAPNGDGEATWKTKGADIVSIIGDETYATAQGPLLDERLVVLDPKTGQVKRDVGSLGATTFGGLAYWAGALYGFTVAGRIFSVDPKTARATEILVKAPANTRFDGAGVTTSAPLMPPG